MTATAAIKTPSQTAGPFFHLGISPAENVVDPATPGAVRIEGRVLDGAGDPVPDALIETWQADPEGLFPPQARPGWGGFGRSSTDEEGTFHVVTLKPGPTISADGTTQAPHIEVQVFARGLLRQLRTRIYFPDEEAANSTDPVLSAIEDPAARATLVARRVGGGLAFDLVLQGDQETVFLGP